MCTEIAVYTSAFVYIRRSGSLEMNFINAREYFTHFVCDVYIHTKRVRDNYLTKCGNYSPTVFLRGFKKTVDIAVIIKRPVEGRRRLCAKSTAIDEKTVFEYRIDRF